MLIYSYDYKLYEMLAYIRFYIYIKHCMHSIHFHQLQIHQ